MTTATKPVTPARTTQQRLDALEHANDIRVTRAVLKRKIKRGQASAVDVLQHPPYEARSMKVLDLLLCMPAVGKVKANKFLSASQVSPSKKVGGLTDRARRALVGHLCSETLRRQDRQVLTART